MNKVCFCYSGEGARGSIQAGITKSLISQGIKPDLTIGVSSGSICAASYSYIGSEGLIDLWDSIDSIFDVFGINYNFLWKNGFLNSKPLERRVREIVNNFPICESIVSKLNIESGEVKYSSNKQSSIEEFINSVIASICITTLVEDKDSWVDAGSRVLAPIDQAVSLGYKNIYIITGRPMHLQYWRKPSGFLALFKQGFRALDISLYEIMLRDINNWINDIEKIKKNDVNITLLQPKQLLFESIEFSKCKTGTQYGLTNYDSFNTSEMRCLFNRYDSFSMLKNEVKYS